MAKNIFGVILASDVDERMRQLKIGVPRGMLEIGGKPILTHQIELMRSIGITDFVLLVKFKRELIEEYFGDGKSFGVNIKYVSQSKSVGIAHAVGQLEKYIDAPFILFLSSIFIIFVFIPNVILKVTYFSISYFFVFTNKYHSTSKPDQSGYS